MLYTINYFIFNYIDIVCIMCCTRISTLYDYVLPFFILRRCLSKKKIIFVYNKTYYTYKLNQIHYVFLSFSYCFKMFSCINNN